jgi:hypothetical protein
MSLGSRISTYKGAFRSIRGDTQSDWPDKETRSRHKRQGGVAGFDTRHAVTARSVVYSVLENGAGDGTGFHTISGPGCGFECGIEDVSCSKSLSGAEYVLE